MALAWKAGWVKALRGSNPLSSATSSLVRPVLTIAHRGASATPGSSGLDGRWSGPARADLGRVHDPVTQPRVVRARSTARRGTWSGWWLGTALATPSSRCRMSVRPMRRPAYSAATDTWAMWALPSSSSARTYAAGSAPTSATQTCADSIASSSRSDRARQRRPRADRRCESSVLPRSRSPRAGRRRQSSPGAREPQASCGLEAAVASASTSTNGPPQRTRPRRRRRRTPAAR